MFRGITLSLSLSLISSDMLQISSVHSSLQPSCNAATQKCDNSAAVSARSVVSFDSVLKNLISGDTVSVIEATQPVSLYNLWCYLLYRWSVVLYFVPLIVIILCKCKVINCDVRLIYGSMPDDSL